MFLRIFCLSWGLFAGPAIAQGDEWINDPDGHGQPPEYKTRYAAVAPHCTPQELPHVHDILVNYAMYIRNELSDPDRLNQQIGASTLSLSPVCLLATRKAVGPYFNMALAQSIGVMLPADYPFPIAGRVPDHPVSTQADDVRCDAVHCHEPAIKSSRRPMLRPKISPATLRSVRP